MIRAKQIENILFDLICQGGGDGDTIREYAEKIAAITDDNGATVEAAILENEVTSMLMDMTVVTTLATLIEEEGGGRTSIRISPAAMELVMANWTYTVEHHGVERDIRIAPKKGDKWEEVADIPQEDRLREMTFDNSPARPQAEPKEYDRPVWAVSFFKDGETGPTLLNCHDRADAERQCRQMDPGLLPEVQNRHCLHPACPSSRCNLWRDDDENPGNGMNPDGN